MNEEIQQSIQKGLNFLTTNQLTNGRFSGLVSPRIDQFRKGQLNDTIFTTALILDCLKTVPASTNIKNRATRYLLQQRSPQWTWNYWDRESSERPYPDDWDDTAYSLAAIVGHDASLVGPTAQALISKQLISCETEAGGPYITWLMPFGAADWQDVDVAVNANIGHMLNRLGVYSAALESYIDTQIEAKMLISPYYVGIIPTLYFISRWYRGKYKESLKKLILQQLDRPQDPLHLAMLVTATYNIAPDYELPTKHIRMLLRLQRNAGWAASALYFEPPQHKTRHYAGSPELTTAFVIEALQNCVTPTEVVQNTLPQERDEITKMATVFKQALKAKVPSTTINKLNRANQDGWAAYTLYDHIIDGQAPIDKTALAMKLITQTRQKFIQALSDDAAYHSCVNRVFATMDAANQWELTTARNPDNLPNYGDLAQLAQRSWGQVLAPLGILMAAGFALDGREAKLLQAFMHHYIIAKQLCDDAHDWEEDLAHGHMTAVVVLLLTSSPDKTLPEQQQYFWEHTILEVNSLIRFHVQKADHYLEINEALVNKHQLKKWLQTIELSCQRAEAGRAAALEFIAGFMTPGLVQ